MKEITFASEIQESVKGFDYLVGGFGKKIFGSRKVTNTIFQIFFLACIIIGASSDMAAVTIPALKTPGCSSSDMPAEKTPKLCPMIPIRSPSIQDFSERYRAVSAKSWVSQSPSCLCTTFSKALPYPPFPRLLMLATTYPCWARYWFHQLLSKLL